jgi:hypothetical protein
MDEAAAERGALPPTQSVVACGTFKEETISFAASENLHCVNNTPDIGFQLGFASFRRQPARPSVLRNQIRCNTLNTFG